MPSGTLAVDVDIDIFKKSCSLPVLPKERNAKMGSKTTTEFVISKRGRESENIWKERQKVRENNRERENKRLA